MKKFIRFLDQTRWRFLLLIGADLIGLTLAFLLAYTIRNSWIGPAIQPFGVYAKAMPVVAGILLVTFYTFGLYERRRRARTMGELFHLVQAITLVWVFIMAVSFLVKYDYSRILVVLLYGLALIFILGGRTLVRQIDKALQRRGIGVSRVLIVGSGKPGRRVAEKLKEYDTFGYRVMGFVDDAEKQDKGDPLLLGTLEDLTSLIRHHAINEVIVADPRLSHERILEAIHQCEACDVKFKVASDLFEILTGDIDLNELEGLPSLTLGTGETKVLYQIIKRLLDVGLSGFALLLFSPLILGIAVLIRWESKGPALFKQKRVGERGALFTLYKFRTMHRDTNPHEHAPKDAKDSRVTRIGGWLRRTSLDEIPQFWNVLKGDMSLVGPRPEMPFIVAGYKEWQRRRLDVKPGITGLWQILGRKNLPLHENIEYDFYYIKNQSLLLDLVILLKTVGVVLRGKGAY